MRLPQALPAIFQGQTSPARDDAGIAERVAPVTGAIVTADDGFSAH